MAIFKPKPWELEELGSGQDMFDEIVEFLNEGSAVEFRMKEMEDDQAYDTITGLCDFEQWFWNDLLYNDDDVIFIKAIFALIGGRMECASFVKDNIKEELAKCCTKIDLVDKMIMAAGLWFRYTEFRNLVERYGWFAEE